MATISKDPLARLAEQQEWIGVARERSLQAAVKTVVYKLGGDSLRRALHGDWLHEPLHAILTDVPVGAWTATVAFDAVAALLPESTLEAPMNHAADATLLLGLLGAVGATVTGMNDWAEVEKPAARTIGLVHAAVNITATVLFAGSGVARLVKRRSLGRYLGAAGYALVSAGAHLGGNLVYEHGIGVVTAPEERITEAMHG